MNKLYIIGNGFDRFHDLPTGYYNYAQWLEETGSEVLDEIYETFGDCDSNWWSGFEQNLASINTIEYASNIAQEHVPDFASDEFRDRDWYEAEYAVEEKLSEMFNDLKQVKEYLEQTEYSIIRSEDYDELLEIRPEIITEENQKEKKHSAIMPEKITKGDYTIFIGKNNRQNDYIVSKLARDEDLWFHTKDCAGSHILLRGENPPDELILECAKLAKEYSSGSASSKVGVIYTKRKYLKKPPKANLGYVTYSHEQEIVID